MQYQPSHPHQVAVSMADSQVQGGQEGSVEDVGVSPQVQKSLAALCLVPLHCPVKGHIALLITAVQV